MIRLSEQLKDHTASAHRRAEETTFVDDLLSGRLSLSAYQALLVQNYLIYEALESVLDQHADDPRIGRILDRRLDRVPALEADLVAHFGSQWRERLHAGELGTTPAALAYAGVLRERGGSPMTVLANHYVRYLGDLSGGQIISTMVERHYGVAKDALAFFDFPLIGKGKPYKDAYRGLLDEVGELLDDASRDELMTEAAEAFELNRKVFLDLQATLPDYRAAVTV